MTGRVADPSIFMAPMMYEFGWDPLDHQRLGRGNGIGHLMECGAQVTGGYFADPGFKDVPEPWNFAFPIAEVEPDGNAVLTKVAGTGGAINLKTVKEQMLYEVHDPGELHHARCGGRLHHRAARAGRPRPRARERHLRQAAHADAEGLDRLHGRLHRRGHVLLRRARARCAARSLPSGSSRSASRSSGCRPRKCASTSSGLNAIHGAMSPPNQPEPYEIAVRVAARSKTREEAIKVGREVDGMAVSGVAMTGKRVPHQDRTREIIGVWSSLVAREKIKPAVSFYES